MPGLVFTKNIRIADMGSVSHPLHIMHIATARTWGGGEAQLLLLLQELQKLGCLQSVFCVRNSALAQKIQTHRRNGLPDIRLAVFCKRFSYDPFAAWKLAQEIRKSRPDLLHLHDAHAHSLGYLSDRVFRHGVPMILHRKVYVQPKAGGLSLKKYRYSGIHKIIAVSNYVKRQLEQIVETPENITVIPDSIALGKTASSREGIKKSDTKASVKDTTNNIRSEFGLSPESRLIVNIGSLLPNKDQATFVQSAGMLHDIKDVCFLIVGDGPEMHKLKDLASRQLNNDRIFFMGFRQDVDSILAQADILVHTPRNEAMGSILLLAMSKKIPIVASDTGGIPELIVSDKTGILAPPGKTVVFAKAVRKLLTEPDFAKKLVSSAWKKVQDFDSVKMASLTLACYRETLAQADRLQPKITFNASRTK